MMRATRGVWALVSSSALALVAVFACGSDDEATGSIRGGPDGPGVDGGEGGVDGAPDVFVYSCDEAGVAKHGETCAEAIDISCGGTFTGSTVGKADDYQTCNTGGVFGGDIAYVVHSPIAQRFSVLATPSASTPNYKIAVHVKRDCAKQFECLSESNIHVNGPAPGSVLDVFDIGAGETAFVIVDGVRFSTVGEENGDYTMTVTPDQTPGATTCANAIDVSNGGSFGSTTLGAGDEYNGNGCAAQKAGDDRVYTLMTSTSKTFELRLDTSSGSGTADVALYIKTDCAASSCVPETNDGTLGAHTRMQLTTTPNVRYYIFVDGKMDPGVNYILHVDPNPQFGTKPSQGNATRG